MTAKMDGVSTEGVISYDEVKKQAQDKDASVRRALAERRGLQPEILYFLAEDDDQDVRRAAAANPDCPVQADLILARDGSVDVRASLADKVARLKPDFDPADQSRMTGFIFEAMEILARDEAARVRRALAEGLKDLPNAPHDIILCLAEDVEAEIACRILEASPVLSDEDLLKLIDGGAESGRLKAISRRKGLGEAISDAIIARKDSGAIHTLLSNQSAQIREDTLDQLIESAAEETSWHSPLVERPNLSRGGIIRLAGYVGAALLDQLRSRPGLDEETAEELARKVASELADSGEVERQEETTAEQVLRLFQSNALTAEDLFEALENSEFSFVQHGLATLSGRPFALVERIMASRSSKAVTALVWAADCPMRLAIQVQLKIARVPPEKVLYALDGVDYPLSDEDMNWQLEFFQQEAD